MERTDPISETWHSKMQVRSAINLSCIPLQPRVYKASVGATMVTQMGVILKQITLDVFPPYHTLYRSLVSGTWVDPQHTMFYKCEPSHFAIYLWCCGGTRCVFVCQDQTSRGFVVPNLPMCELPHIYNIYIHILAKQHVSRAMLMRGD